MFATFPEYNLSEDNLAVEEQASVCQARWHTKEEVLQP
jgi:hypothetical protein